MKPCKLWTKGKNSNGYGCKWVPEIRQNRGVHVLALEEKIGRKLVAGELACHTCDVRACYEPEHLFVGSNLDNIRDMQNKGRNRGINAKLSIGEVAMIKKRLLQGDSGKSIAKDFNVTKYTISDIKRGKTWAYVEVLSGV